MVISEEALDLPDGLFVEFGVLIAVVVDEREERAGPERFDDCEAAQIACLCRAFARNFAKLPGAVLCLKNVELCAWVIDRLRGNVDIFRGGGIFELGGKFIIKIIII